MIWGPMAVTYREKYHTEYMPIGGGRFLFQLQILTTTTNPSGELNYFYSTIFTLLS